MFTHYLIWMNVPEVDMFGRLHKLGEWATPSLQMTNNSISKLTLAASK